MSDDSNKKTSSGQKESLSQKPNKGHGPQGVDKAPGEEEAEDLSNFKENTQQGKQQVDADVTKESDRAIDE